jgi:hypothetical protein
MENKEYWLVEQFDGNGDIIYTESFLNFDTAHQEYERRKSSSLGVPKIRAVRLLQE